MSGAKKNEKDLRKKAEERVEKKALLIDGIPPDNLESMSISRIKSLIHDLQVHQIELEMQNDELRRTREELEIIKSRYFDLYDLAPVGYLTVSAKGMIEEINFTAAVQLGINRNESLNNPLSRFIFREDQDIYYHHNKTLFKTQEPQSYDLRMLRKDGTLFWVHIDAAAAAVKESKETVCRLVMNDISEYKNAEELLRRSEYRFKTAFSMSPDAVNINRLADGEYIDVNNGFIKMTGYKREDVIGKTSFEINIWERMEDRKKLVQGLKERGQYSNLEANFIKKDGSLSKALMSASIIDLEGKPHILSITRDISKLKQTELLLMLEKERLDVTLRCIGDGVISTDIKGNILILNKAAEEMTGWKSEEACGLPLPEVFKIINEITREKCENPHEKALSSGTIVEMDSHTCLIAKDGMEIIIGASSAPIYDRKRQIIGLVIVFRDISEKQKLHSSLQRAQKLESLGILAGGIAHDFNNLLSGIFGYMEIAAAKTTEKDVSVNLLKSLNTIDRARSLTQQLLTFARGGAPTKKVDSLFPFIKDTVQFALSGSSVLSQFQIQKNLWLCDFDRNQIGQVIDNIIINAQQAMPGGGKIAVSAENISLPGKEILLAAGNYVKISIKDQGIGIPKEFILQIFDPYYTTKPKGHGLGLATCYSIINRHDGAIEVESEPGKGTTFNIFLPASTEDDSSGSEKEVDVHTGKGTFLIMDDEEIIRDILKEYLESFGYKVVLKDNGKESIDFVKEEIRAKRKIAGIIFDLTVPGGMGGKEAIGPIREIYPDIPAFVTSGYSDDPVMANPEEYGFNASIRKPFMMGSLSEMLEKYIKD